MGELTETEGRRELTSAPTRAPADELARLVEEHQSWLAVERSLAASSLAAYRRDLRRYAGFLCQQGLTASASAVGERTIAAYLDHLRGLTTPEGTPRLVSSSIARALVAVRSFHRFCLAEGHLASDPTEDLGVPRVPRGIPKALSEVEIAALLAPPASRTAAALRDQAILETLYGTGIRISELVSLDRSAFDLGERFIRVLGKGSRERVVPVGRVAIAELVAYLDGARPELASHARRGSGPALFLNARGGRLTRQGCWQIVARRGRAAGLGERLSPHVLRHSFATHLVDRGADIRVVQELLGHRRVTTTQIYTKVTNARLRAVYEAAHPRARG